MPTPPLADAADAAPPAAFDPSAVDAAALARALKALRAELRDALGPEDLAHLRRVERWGRACTLLGYGTAWIAPNPASCALISQGILTRWLLMHHISHRAYDRIPGVPPRYTSAVFARGWRRLIDWMDWILPEAWHEEHDFLHHYNLGEDADPDLLERNTAWMEEEGLATWQRDALLALLSLTWKWLYYAPSTLDALQRARARRAGAPAPAPANLLDPRQPRGRELWLKSLLPHALLRFALIPALFAPLGWRAARNVLLNSLGAELVTNLHAFLVIGPNHSGDDLYRFDEPAGSPDEFYLRQIVGSANYTCGSDLVDYLQMWLNYQIEHHIWPDLTMLQYQRVQPRVAALCQAHGIPYVQASVFKRAREMARVVTGRAAMKRVRSLLGGNAGRRAAPIDG